MKRLFAFVMAFIMIFALAACSEKTETPEVEEEQTEITENEESPKENESISVSVGDIGKKDEVGKTETAKPEPSQKTETPKPAHTHKYTSSKTEATCKSQGYTTHTCSCGYSYKDNYVNNKCSYCGKANTDALFSFMKSWVSEKGTVYGDYVYYSKPADNYGGYSGETFRLSYWADSNQVEFCLHSEIDADYSINFYLYIPQTFNGTYQYIASYYYRSTGEAVCESRGTITASSFDKNSPLPSKNYYGPVELQNDFTELSRVGICDAISCLKQFLQKENLGYTICDLGFKNF